MHKLAKTKTLFIILISSIAFYLSKQITTKPQNQNSTPSISVLSPPKHILTTQSKFTQKTTTITKQIPYQTKYIDDPNANLGTNTLITKGINGEKEITTTTTYYNNKGSSKDKHIITC